MFVNCAAYRMNSEISVELPAGSFSSGHVALFEEPAQFSRNEPCPCGSTMRFKECCGYLGEVVVSTNVTPDALQRQLRLALNAKDADDWLQAEGLCHQILAGVPNQMQALRLLVAIKLHQDDSRAAGLLLQRLLRHFPHDAAVLTDAAEFLERQGDAAQAEANLAKALRLDPHHRCTHIALARLAQRRGNVGVAEVHLREAHFLDNTDADVAADLGRVLNQMGRKAEAEHYFRIALSLRPDDVSTLLSWADMEESRGDLPAAWNLLERARAVEPEFPVIPLAEATLHVREQRYREALTSLKQVDRPRLSMPARSLYYFTRGKVLDKLARYDDAFESLRRANALSIDSLGIRYDPDWHHAYAERLKQFFTRERMRSMPRARPRSDDQDSTPIFITCFPRSGATLIEQILSMHSNITAGDEIFCVPDIRNHAPAMLGVEETYPECLAHVGEDPRFAYQCREEYLTSVRLAGIMEPGVGRFTDKLPLKEWDLGFISLMFPDAPVIHVVRHPLDAVLSAFSSDVRHGSLCAFNLLHAAQHYALTMDLMAHCQQHLDIKILRVRYEDVIADIKEQTRRMLEFLDEPFEPQCVEFHLNPHRPRSRVMRR
jgi:Tfp pilus assembly protein PilF